MPITPESKVTLHFSLSLSDGTLMDATEQNDPISFQMGDGTLIEGLELALMGLDSGDTQTINIEPREGFGMPDEGKVQAMPRAEFGADFELKPGLIVGFENEQGQEIAGTILEVGDDQVMVDFNHPLAGREIVFTVEILDVA